MKLKVLVVFFAVLAGMLVAQARQVVPFNDGWQFKRGPFSGETSAAVAQWNGKWDDVTLPHTWNADDMQRHAASFYEGAGYYRRNLRVSPDVLDGRVFLRFEGVGSVAEVYVNGQLAGTHKGGYSAFAVEIGGLLKPDADNAILVKADNSARRDVIPVNHNLFGVYGGIYRPVWLITTPKSNITVMDCASPGVYITQRNVSRKSADVSVRVKLDNAFLTPDTLEWCTSVYDDDGRCVQSRSVPVVLTPQGTQTFTADFTVRRPHLWHGRKDPYLYKVVTELKRDGSVADRVEQPLGLRHYDIRAGEGFFLNGEKYPMYGVTRHQDWQGIGSALTNREHDADLAQIMEIGATTVRFAHYQQSDYIYSRCDSLGLIVWAEIPFVNRVTGEEAENAHSQLRELIRQSFNHPSIYVWGLHNEVYQPHAYTAALTASLHDLAKTEDPDRFTAAVNGYGIAHHPVNQNADIQGMNRYFGWYEKTIPDIEPWVQGLERDYPWQRLMLTEYGADANIEHQTECLGNALNWTKPFYPETFQTKTHEYHWGVISRHPYIIASYLWNMFDFAVPMWSRGGVEARNLKGLVTFDRQTRKDSFYWYKANWSQEPVMYITQRRNVDRERRNTSVTVYSNVGEPKVYLNGELLPAGRVGYTPVHYVFDNVELRDGENVVKAVCGDSEEYADEVKWMYTGEKVRGADARENRNEHAGW